MTFAAFIEAERQGWDARATGYSDATARATLQVAPALLDAVRPVPGQRLLDIACGPGNVAAMAAAMGLVAEGVDYAPAMIDMAQQNFPDLSFAVADAQALPHADAEFDLAVCNMGLFHMGDPAQALAEAARVLRQGGRFGFTQWAAPAASELYGRLFAVLKEHADLSRADPAPDAYMLSDEVQCFATLSAAGFGDLTCVHHPTRMVATGTDFFDLFMRFGVRVPLIVAAQDKDVQARLRDEMNKAMEPFKTADGFDVPMPSLIFAGVKQ